MFCNMDEVFSHEKIYIKNLIIIMLCKPDILSKHRCVIHLMLGPDLVMYMIDASTFWIRWKDWEKTEQGPIIIQLLCKAPLIENEVNIVSSQ